MPHHISSRYGMKYKFSGSRGDSLTWISCLSMSSGCNAKGWPEEQSQDWMHLDRNGCLCDPGRSQPFPGSHLEHFQLGSLGKAAQAFQHQSQEPEQPFLVDLSLLGCLQRPSALSSGDNVTLSTEGQDICKRTWGSWKQVGSPGVTPKPALISAASSLLSP